MQTEKEPLQVRLPKGSSQKLKVLAAKTGTSISAIVQEALDQWWKQNPKALEEGPLFANESTTATVLATPKEEKTEDPKSPALKPVGAKKKSAK